MIPTKIVLYRGQEKSTMFIPVQTIMLIWSTFFQMWQVTELASVMPHNDQLSKFDLCNAHNGNCSHICTPSVNNTEKVQCSCPLGFQLNADTRTCSILLACGRDTFKCQVPDEKCIPSKYRCDGEIDCTDGSDEENCDQCAEGQFRCEMNVCIKSSLVCDGVSHCPNGTDESDCCSPKSSHYNSAYFPCDNGEGCFPFSYFCNGFVDCADASDEPYECGKMKTAHYEKGV